MPNFNSSKELVQELRRKLAKIILIFQKFQPKITVKKLIMDKFQPAGFSPRFIDSVFRQYTEKYKDEVIIPKKLPSTALTWENLT